MPGHTVCNFAEVAAHEIGHAIGLDHSSEGGATMFQTAHNDGRCAALRDDDRAGLSFVYPIDVPVLTITTPSQLPDR